MIETNEGTMTFVSNERNIEKLKWTIVSLEELIETDKSNNDEKSLKYHSLALEESKKQLEKLLASDEK